MAAVVLLATLGWAISASTRERNTHGQTPVARIEDPSRPVEASPTVHARLQTRWSLAAAASAPEQQRVSVLRSLRDWAASDPDAAFAWLRKDSSSLRLAGMVVLMEEVAQRPDLALRLGRVLLAEEPDLVADAGTALVAGFVRAGHFGVALDFVQSAPNDCRGPWLTTVFAAWVHREPSFARELVALFGGESGNSPAYHAVMQSWCTVAPAEAAQYALSLSPGPARQIALGLALPTWAAEDPAGLAAALPRFQRGDERDRAATCLICRTDSVNRPTATALAWAEAVEDPVLRQKAVLHVLREWAQQDPSDVAEYLDRSDRLQASEREALLAALARNERGSS